MRTIGRDYVRVNPRPNAETVFKLVRSNPVPARHEADRRAGLVGRKRRLEPTFSAVA